MGNTSTAVLFTLFAALLAPIALRADEPASPASKSRAAVNAAEKCDKAIADADAAYKKVILQAKFQMNVDLRKAQQNALRDGQQDEALAIAAQIKKTEDEMLALKSGATAGPGIAPASTPRGNTTPSDNSTARASPLGTREILNSIPADLYPATESGWTQDKIDRATKALAAVDNKPGQFRVPVDHTQPSPTDRRGTSLVVSFETVIDHHSVFYNCYFKDEMKAEVAKLKNRDVVTVTGTIHPATFQRHGDKVALNIDVADCTLSR